MSLVAGPRSVLLIGHSNCVAIAKGLEMHGRETGRPPVIDRINLYDDELRPNWRDGALHPGIARAVDEALAARRHDLVIAAVRGNYHSLIGLIQHPQPFDFVLRPGDEAGVVPGATILPLVQVREILLQGMGDLLLNVLSELARRIGSERMICPSPPPPVRENDYILRNARLVREKAPDAVINPPALRMKLWRLHARILEEHCREIGIPYLPPPRECRDEDGFLGRDFWFNDPTHGNEAYGRRVVDQILALAAGGSPLSPSAG